MALSRIKTWIAGDTLTAADLNAEFNNILNNPISLISPTTGAINFQTSVLHTNLLVSALAGSSAGAGAVLVTSTAAAPVAQWLAIGTSGQVVTAGTSGGIIFAAAAAGGADPSIDLDPASAVFTSANFPQLVKSTMANFPKYLLGYDGASREAAQWYVNLTTNISSVTSAIIELWLTATSSGGASVWAINTATLTSGTDVDAIGSTAVTSTATSVASSLVNRITVGLAASSWVTPSILKIQIARNTTDAGDVSTGDQYLYHASIKIDV